MIWITQITLLILVLSLSATETDADVYRYESNDGSVCFTDAPGRKNAVLYLRETRTSRKTNRTASTPVRKYLTSTSRPVKTRTATSGLKCSRLPVSGMVTSAPGFRADPFSGQIKNHNGIDIAVVEGTSVRPVSSGVVTYSGNRNGYGNIVIVDHEDGLVTLYAHNSQNMVSIGEKVGLNSVIARTGSTGRSTGPHLHFEAWRMGENVTPEFLPESWGPRRFVNLPIVRKKTYVVRKVVMDDGTILLTNLPLVHP